MLRIRREQVGVDEVSQLLTPRVDCSVGLAVLCLVPCIAAHLPAVVLSLQWEDGRLDVRRGVLCEDALPLAPCVGSNAGVVYTTRRVHIGKYPLHVGVVFRPLLNIEKKATVRHPPNFCLGCCRAQHRRPVIDVKEGSQSACRAAGDDYVAALLEAAVCQEVVNHSFQDVLAAEPERGAVDSC